MNPESGSEILFIDDEPHIRIAGVQTLELHGGYRAEGFESAQQALPRLARDWPGVVICDIKMPVMDGMEFLRRALEIDRDLPVILITGHGDIAMAVDAMRQGAYDFIEKPFPAERLIESVRRALEKRALTLENRNLRSELASQNSPGPRLIGRTPEVQRLRSTIAQLADLDADVLICGETGTGKELVARSLHEQSRRREHNYVAVNCGAMADNLIESELFGHEAGAFTGAKGRRIGRVEHADHGTLFLDEIESMPLNVQVHLLRVLQERQLERVGSNKLIPLDLRVVAASKVDLKRAGESGEFREDLYYRLNVVSLEIPPLRERLEDIPLLFHHFLLLAAERYGREVPPLAMEQLPLLMSHSWPGNVRELRNVAERYLLLGEGVGFELGRLLHGKEGESAITLPQQVECFEKSLIQQQLTLQQGNVKQTMLALGIPRKTLYDKMKKYGLDKSHYKQAAETDQV